MNNVLMIMTVREISPVRESIEKIDIPKVWFKGYTEFELNTHINKFIQETSYDNYFILSDDAVVPLETANLLIEKINDYPIVTGWCLWRQNHDWTTIQFQDKLHLFNASSSFPVFKKHYNIVRAHEVHKLPEEFETAFPGWCFTGARREVWLEYPFQTLSVDANIKLPASTDVHWGKRVLAGGKYKQMCFKKAKLIHLSYLNTKTGIFDFTNKQIIKELD